MPVGFNSAARNLFLLGSSGADLITNFFQRIDQSSTPYNNHQVSGIRYNDSDQKYILSGYRTDVNDFIQTGWVEKRSASGSLDWNKIIRSTLTAGTIELRALELDNNKNIIACGWSEFGVPYVTKYNNSGESIWTVSSSTFSIFYNGIAIDDNNDIYLCGSYSGDSYIEKVSSSGSYLWGRSISNSTATITLNKCSANNRGEIVCVGSIEDETKTKGYIVKIDTSTGEILWDRTIENPSIAGLGSYWQTECIDVYIDNNDQIYIIGNSSDQVTPRLNGFIIKYTAEGNIIWQKETDQDETIAYVNVRSDTETEQTIVLGFYYDNVAGNPYLLLSKYSKDGSLIWRRKLNTDYDTAITPYRMKLDADPSFYYLLFTDDLNQEGYVFGKVSTSGNGFGNFTYNDGVANVFYQTLNVVDKIGRLTDGSVRQDSSDLITYPFEANKILFDDLATQVANKKVQLDLVGTYTNSSYSITTGYPRISTDEIVYGSNLLLNYDFKNKATYSGTGSSVNNLAGINGTSYTGTINGATFNSAGYFDFDGSNDDISVGSSFTLSDTNSVTIESWVNADTTTNTFQVIATAQATSTHWQLSYAGDPTYNILWAFAGTSNSVGTTTLPSLGTWHHIVATYNGGDKTQLASWKVYIDGSSATIQLTGSTGAATNATTIGFRTGGAVSNRFDGKIGETRIYNKALTAAEVSQNFNATRAKYGV